MVPLRLLFAKLDWRVVAVVAAVVLAMGWLHFHDAAVVSRHEAQIEADAAPAREEAAEERVQDAASNAANEGDLHNAIDTAPSGGALSPPAHGLACERLRKLGRFPPSCRSAGDDGNQAGAQ